MSLRQDMSHIKDLFREINADSRLTNKQVYSLLQTHTEWLIHRESDRLKILNHSMSFQDVECIPVILAPATECANIGTNCKLYRTENKLPDLFEDTSGPILSSVSSVDGWTQIYLVTPAEFRRQMNNPWIAKSKTKKILGYFLNGYIYFPDEHIKMITVRGLFKNPIKKDPECNPCAECYKPCDRYLDQESFIPKYLKAQVFQNVIQELGNTYERLPEKSHEINKNVNTKA